MLFIILFLGLCVAFIRLYLRHRQREGDRKIVQAVAQQELQERVAGPMRNGFEGEMNDVVGSILAKYGMDDPQTHQEVLASTMEGYDEGTKKALAENPQSEKQR